MQASETPSPCRNGTLPARAWSVSGVELVAFGLDAEDADLAALERLLSEDERRRAQRFCFERDRRRFVVARARLRQQLGARLGARPASIVFAYGAQGKPALGGRHAGAALAFNASHSAELGLCAFAEGRALGVDVEAIRPLEDADALAERFFSRHEVAAYRALPQAARRRAFFDGWTRKEAFIKAIGEGLSHPLDRFDVTLDPGVPARLLRVGTRRGEDCGWELHAVTPLAGHAAALVVERPQDGRRSAGAPAGARRVAEVVDG